MRQATLAYSSNLPGSPAEEYLRRRGLANAPDIEKYALGYVAEPLPGHEPYRGWLAIPFLRPGACASIRFRCLEDHDHEGHGKYMTVSGDQPWIYNTAALGGDEVGICEGEIDAITATACGYPSIGVSGVEAWQDSWDRLFDGYRRVLVFADGDVPGRKFARKIASRIDTAKVIDLGDGYDVNDYVMTFGAEKFRERTT